jgi:hypothetical protein
MELGMSIEVKPVQPQNALISMDVTELGMSIEVKPVQHENAIDPMDVTELGMVTEVMPLLKNPSEPIPVTL